MSVINTPQPSEGEHMDLHYKSPKSKPQLYLADPHYLQFHQWLHEKHIEDCLFLDIESGTSLRCVDINNVETFLQVLSEIDMYYETWVLFYYSCAAILFYNSNFRKV